MRLLGLYLYLEVGGGADQEDVPPQRRVEATRADGCDLSVDVEVDERRLVLPELQGREGRHSFTMSGGRRKKRTGTISRGGGEVGWLRKGAEREGDAGAWERREEKHTVVDRGRLAGIHSVGAHHVGAVDKNFGACRGAGEARILPIEASNHCLVLHG